MFERKRPCANCPFRIGIGSRFGLPKDRLDEIRRSPAFQCHKTVDYEQFDDPVRRQGNTPQQCAGLMVVLVAESDPNQIMQVGERLRGFFPEKLDRAEAYGSWAEVERAHLEGIEPERDKTDQPTSTLQET